MLLHSAGMWTRWSALTEVVRRGGAAAAPPTPRSPEGLAAFIGAMHCIGRGLAAEIVRSIAPGRRLLDVGGASGTYTEALLAASPELEATLFDLPPVIEMARRRLGEAGLLGRVTLVAGDFYRDELPAGHDLVLLSAIIHQNSPAQNVELYRKCWRALEPGGRIVVRDHVMSPDHLRPLAGALFAINMLVSSEGGGTYSPAELRETLEAAGFVNVRLLRDGERMDALVEAEKRGTTPPQPPLARPGNPLIS